MLLALTLFAFQESTPQLELIASGTRSFSGVYPHLASFNSSNECGTGAVVPWAGKLWWVTYAPHAPRGSDDRLYAMDAAGDLFAWSGSLGGTPANRFVHEESQQLFIGPYVIDAEGSVRAIPYSEMLGRPTGTARHLVEPERKVYTATMEEGLYEIDVDTLEVTTLFSDTQAKESGTEAELPGYHGKGLYSGQGVLVYANNGEHGREAQQRPEVPSGVLAEWSGEGDWRVVRRNQFTEVTGPGGIRGSGPDDPLWSVGWDHRSLLLMVRSTSEEEWQTFRLPKASHAYDGAHGWNTEWPRIRDIGEEDLLMTMHGTFWRFPRTFDAHDTRGIEPRSTYLRVVGDFCRHGDDLVLGCDDAARSEFLNTRRAKGEVAGPAESQSNLWFVQPEALDSFGPALGRGAVFLDDEVEGYEWSDPFLFSGYDLRGVHLAHDGDEPVTFRFEVDPGDGRWERWAALVDVPVDGSTFHSFEPDAPGTWVRVAASRAARVTVAFEMRNRDGRGVDRGDAFASLAAPGEEALGGLLRAGGRSRGLQVLASHVEGGTASTAGYYELRPDLSLEPVESDEDAKWMAARVAIPAGVVQLEGSSLLYVDDEGRRWRLPVGNPAYLDAPELLDLERTAREVVTERDLFQAGGTFFELPARNAGGFAKVRPIATHDRFVHDYCSWRGLLCLTGVAVDAGEDPRVIRSSDGRCAVWLGAIDDLWQLGKPRGVGGPWHDEEVEAHVPSDPFLAAGYDRKSVELMHDSDSSVTFTLEGDITGDGSWQPVATLAVSPGERANFAFPDSYGAYWLRVAVDVECRATALFTYR